MVAALLAAAVLTPATPARPAESPLAVANEITTAISAEKVVLSFFKESPVPWNKVVDWLQRSKLDLGYAKSKLGGAASQLHPGDATRIGDDIDDAIHQDSVALAGARAKSEAKVKAALERALAIKQKAFLVVENYSHGERCTAEKPFQVFAVPEGYAGSYAEVYPHGIPKDAKGIHVTFIDTATGKAPGVEVFPGQTWKATVKGYQPDGKFVVHIDVSGTGFGKPDANVKNWKVVVTYDCP